MTTRHALALLGTLVAGALATPGVAAARHGADDPQQAPQSTVAGQTDGHHQRRRRRGRDSSQATGNPAGSDTSRDHHRQRRRGRQQPSA